jgi:hypothetical protein
MVLQFKGGKKMFAGRVIGTSESNPDEFSVLYTDGEIEVGVHRKKMEPRTPSPVYIGIY